MRALVLGDDTRSFLAAVRSLGRAGWNVDAAPHDSSSPALGSCYPGTPVARLSRSLAR